jgi:hypothetical protein
VFETPRSVNSPFVVGISKQRDLEPSETGDLVCAVGHFLDDLARHLPNTELHLMIERGDAAGGSSGGAIGDAIARAAIARGLHVEALVSPSRPDDASLGAVATDTGTASSVTDVLIRRSSLLLALWDGSPSRAGDDTAATIERFLGVRAERRDAAKAFEIATVLDDSDVTAQLVFWVPVSRHGAVPPGGPPARPRAPCYLHSVSDNVIDALPDMPASLKRRLADLDEYNLEFARCRANGTLAGSESLMRGLAPEMTAGDAAILRNIDAQYVKADALAGHMQWRSDRLFNLFGVMTFTMGIAYLIYDQIFESRILLIVYIVVLFAGFAAYYVFQQKRWFGKHLAYRALAETLRVRFYLALAGLDYRLHTGDLIALTGIHRFRGFSWIGFVLDTIESPALVAHQSDEAYRLRGRFVEETWVEGQYHYFVSKVAQMEKMSRRVDLMKGVVFVAACVVIGAMFIFGEALHRVDSITGLPVKNVLTFCSGFLAVLLGVWELRQNKMATRELLWQYRNQLHQFARARTQLQRSSSKRARDDLLMELGDNSLMETYLWAIHRYHREHAPPALH